MLSASVVVLCHDDHSTFAVYPSEQSKVDWSSVISACKASFKFEKRLANFYIRGLAHDALSFGTLGDGGADGSLLNFQSEINSTNNKYDDFVAAMAPNGLAIAKKYGVSVADVIAVCGAVAPEFLGGPQIVRYDTTAPFLVGRLDSTVANPAEELAPRNITTLEFSERATKYGLTIPEFTSLMGAHSLFAKQKCRRGGGGSIQKCDPTKENCNNVDMFTWSNNYFIEACTADIKEVEYILPTLPPLDVTEGDKADAKTGEQCEWTSAYFRSKADKLAENEADDIPEAELGGGEEWFYDAHDAEMGLACQNKLTTTIYNNEIGSAMKSFTNKGAWDSVFITAFIKISNINAHWNGGSGTPITGYECPSGYVLSDSRKSSTTCDKCNVNISNFASYSCPNKCICSTAVAESKIYYTQEGEDVISMVYTSAAQGAGTSNNNSFNLKVIIFTMLTSIYLNM